MNIRIYCNERICGSRVLATTTSLAYAAEIVLSLVKQHLGDVDRSYGMMGESRRTSLCESKREELLFLGSVNCASQEIPSKLRLLRAAQCHIKTAHKEKIVAKKQSDFIARHGGLYGPLEGLIRSKGPFRTAWLECRFEDALRMAREQGIALPVLEERGAA